MKITINKQELELKYSFNSFKYMQDFDLSGLEEVETKPFKIVPIVEMLLLGGLNHNPKIKYNEAMVAMFLEDFLVEGSISDLLEELMTLLQDSNFFKSLQKKEQQVQE